MDIYTNVRILFLSILIFSLLFIPGKIMYKKLKNSDNRIFNPLEYFPEEEFQTLKQVFYLVMMLIFFVLILYLMVVENADYIGICFLQIIVSLYVALRLDYSLWYNKVLFFLLVPYESISIFAFNQVFELWPIWLIHTIVYIYLMKVYFGKFRQYTETNSLGITIILLFVLIFTSFIVTSIVESVDPLSALVMVSNAFTSNGYAILGKTGIGKLNSLILVWGG